MTLLKKFLHSYFSRILLRYQEHLFPRTILNSYFKTLLFSSINVVFAIQETTLEQFYYFYRWFCLFKKNCIILCLAWLNPRPANSLLPTRRPSPFDLFNPIFMEGHKISPFLTIFPSQSFSLNFLFKG